MALLTPEQRKEIAAKTAGKANLPRQNTEFRPAQSEQGRMDASFLNKPLPRLTGSTANFSGFWPITCSYTRARPNPWQSFNPLKGVNHDQRHR